MFSFSSDFLNSKFCNNSLDKPYSVDQFADIFNWLEFLAQEDVRFFITGENTLPKEVAGWLGFTYRQLHFETGLPSKQLCEIIPIERLVLSYEGLHTVDEDMASEILIENFIQNRKDTK